MFQNYVRNSIVLNVISGEEETDSHLFWHFGVTRHHTHCTNSTPDWEEDQAKRDNSLPEPLICLQKAANHTSQFQSSLFVLRCKNRWITPTTERNAIFRTTYMGRQTSSVFVYSRDEKIHRDQSAFVWNSQDGWMSRALDWKTLPPTLPGSDKRYIYWLRKKKEEWWKGPIKGISCR